LLKKSRQTGHEQVRDAISPASKQSDPYRKRLAVFHEQRFYAGATLLPDGSTLLLCRVEDRRGLSHLCVARSANGVDGWQIDREPTFIPDVERFPEELWGVEDPRITYMPELQQYAVAYTSYSRGGPGVSLALTKDFRVFEKLGSSCRRTTKTRPFCPEGLTALGL